MRFAVSIAGSDPTGGAGLQADLQVFRSHGVHGGGVPTALTVQDGRKVKQVLPLFPSVVLAQLRALFGGARPDAVKLGMLATDDVARSVALGLAALPVDRPPPIVIDPVLAASDGTPLLERRAYGTLQEMLHGVALVTPNLAEAEALTGHDATTHEGAERAARAFVMDLGARAALVKGGHRAGDADDLLAWREGEGVSFRWLAGARIEGGAHGTGCALSAAIAARLAQDEALLPAVEGARAFVRAALAGAFERGGARFLGIP
jgi:hydroxymethylpyrimidine kinase/phosphomethylpyrimidine kinase